MAEYIHVSYSTFRGWITYNRTPSLKTLDEISNVLSIPTYILMIHDLHSRDIDGYIDNEINNNSPLYLSENLISAYRDKGLNSWGAVENIYGSLLSRESLKSYHRKNENRTPT